MKEEVKEENKENKVKVFIVENILSDNLLVDELDLDYVNMSVEEVEVEIEWLLNKC